MQKRAQIFLLLLMCLSAGGYIKADEYDIDSIDKLYVTNAELAQYRIDSLGRRLEQNGWKECSRSRYEIVYSYVSMYQYERGECLRHANQAYLFAEREKNVNNMLMALQQICDQEYVNGFYFILMKNAQKLDSLASYLPHNKGYFKAVAKVYMSSVYLDRKNLDKAISLLDEAAVISQKDNSKANEEIVRTELMYSKCFSYYRMEEYQQAEAIGEQILKFLDSGRHFTGMDPNGVQIARLRAMTIMALIKGKQGDKKKAEEYADEALRLLKKFPGVPDVRGRLSESLYHLGRYGDLRTIAEPIIGNKYPSLEIRACLGYLMRVSLIEGKDEESKELFEKYSTISRSLESRMRDYALEELSLSYKVADMEKQVSSQEKRSMRLLIFLMGSVILLVLLGAILYYSNRSFKKRMQDNQYLYEQVKKSNEKKKEEKKKPVNVRAEEMDVEASVREFLIRDDNLSNPNLSLKPLEKESGVKLYLLNSKLMEKTGKTISAYVLDLRLKRACDLLEHTDDILESVAEKCGFGSDRTLYRQFKQAYNITPTAFRKMSRIAKGQK